MWHSMSSNGLLLCVDPPWYSCGLLINLLPLGLLPWVEGLDRVTTWGVVVLLENGVVCGALDVYLFTTQYRIGFSLEPPCSLEELEELTLFWFLLELLLLGTGTHTYWGYWLYPPPYELPVQSLWYLIPQRLFPFTQLSFLCLGESQVIVNFGMCTYWEGAPSEGLVNTSLDRILQCLSYSKCHGICQWLPVSPFRVWNGYIVP